MSQPIRIVLTGGPRGGKTSLLGELQERMVGATGFAREVATRLLEEGHPVPLGANEVRHFQTRVLEEQRRVESALDESHPEQPHILDRGVPDGASYWPGGQQKFARHFELHWEAELLRYQIVLHLESHLAQDAEVHAGNRERFESHDQARALDLRIRSIWQDHPGYLLLEARPDLEDKITMAVDHLTRMGLL